MAARIPHPVSTARRSTYSTLVSGGKGGRSRLEQ